MASPRKVVVGVDTHADTHTAAVCDELGRLVEFATFTAELAGYRQLFAWARRYGQVEAFGVEGTGGYGAGLARFLTAHDQQVIEVNRINRQHRRRHGKSDPLDAEAAARAVLSGEATAIPRQRLAQVEAVRVLRIARRSAVHAKTKAANQIRDLVVTAPDDVRAELAGLRTEQRVRLAARWRPGPVIDARAATRVAIHRLAKRWLALQDEARELETLIRQQLETLVPSLLAETGVSTHVAASLVVAVGENPERLRSEASFAALCGTSPIAASSGKKQPPSTQPRRGPPSQLRAPHRGVDPLHPLPGNTPLHRTSHQFGSHPTRHLAMPQTSARPAIPPNTHQRPHPRLDIGASRIPRQPVLGPWCVHRHDP